MWPVGSKQLSNHRVGGRGKLRSLCPRKAGETKNNLRNGFTAVTPSTLRYNVPNVNTASNRIYPAVIIAATEENVGRGRLAIIGVAEAFVVGRCATERAGRGERRVHCGRRWPTRKVIWMNIARIILTENVGKFEEGLREMRVRD